MSGQNSVSNNSGRGDAEILMENFSDLELFFNAALYKVPIELHIIGMFL